MIEAKETTTKAWDDFDRQKNELLNEIELWDQKIRELNKKLKDLKENTVSSSWVKWLQSESPEDDWVEIRQRKYTLFKICQTMVDSSLTLQCAKCL